MRLALAVALILASITIVFSLQNSQPVAVKFLGWSFEASLVIVLLITFISGVVAAFLSSIPWWIKKTRNGGQSKKTDLQ